jgi:hypothetical protein
VSEFPIFQLEAIMNRRSQNLLRLLVLAVLPAACSESPTEPEITAVTPALSVTVTGNGAPSGAHYNLNIIGVPHEKSADMSEGGGHVIFVGLGSTNSKKTTRIVLSPGDDFLVLDKNGTDGRASFQLPSDVSSTYSVFARALGKPGGEASLMLCAMEPGLDGVLGTDDDVEICGGTEVFMRNKKFTDVSATLLFLSATVDPESTLGICLGLDDPLVEDEPDVQTDIGLFDPCLEGYLWEYTNSGLKLLQFRFYPI